jgi:hypothetical protein
VLLRTEVSQTSTVFSSGGIGSSTIGAAVGAIVSGPNGSAAADLYGVAVVPVYDRGPQTITAQSGNRVPDRATVCITAGSDGYCGTEIPPVVPFDPLNYCVTTGDDGECGTIDTRPPVGHIEKPLNGKTYSGSARPDTLQGTVDHDHSEVALVRLALKRQITVKVTKYKKKKVRVKKKVHGKVRRVVVRKRVPYKVKATRCYSWNNAATDWKLLKSCSAAVPLFNATGGDYWTYEFPSPLPGGTYTLDAHAVDGVGNVDSTPEVGRNRAIFKVS